MCGSITACLLVYFYCLYHWTFHRIGAYHAWIMSFCKNYVGFNSVKVLIPLWFMDFELLKLDFTTLLETHYHCWLRIAVWFVWRAFHLKNYSCSLSDEQIVFPDYASCLSVKTFLHMCGLKFGVELRTNAEEMSPSGKNKAVCCTAFLVEFVWNGISTEIE